MKNLKRPRKCKVSFWHRGRHYFCPDLVYLWLDWFSRTADYWM